MCHTNKKKFFIYFICIFIVINLYKNIVLNLIVKKNFMALKKLVEVWDGKNLIESNIEFLKQKTKEVHRPFTDETKQILNDLLDVYKATPCAGVAANQIGYSKRIFIGLKHDVSDNKDNSNAIGNPNANNYEFYINPQIDHSSNKSIRECEEGCLSVPEIRLMTERV